MKLVMDMKAVNVQNKTLSTANTLTWKFAAQNVHDFVWAADTAYTMIKKQMPNGPLFYFVYKKVDSLQAAWENVARYR